MTCVTNQIGERALFDTCIMLDYFRGIKEARNTVRKCSERYISALTWLELVSCLPPEQNRAITEFSIQNFTTIPVERDVVDQAAFLRQEKKLSLINSILYGSARVYGANFLTRNIEDFDPEWLDVYAPYEL